MDWLIEEFLRETGLDIRADRMALQRLKEAAERAKCELSVSESAAVNLPFIATGAEGPLHLSRSISQGQFEAMVAPLVERTAEPCRQALKGAGLGPHEIDEILLVGGQTRSPIVAREVERIFGKAPNDDINPDEVVAVGAAIQGGILRGDVKDIVLLDVTPLSLGVETQGGLFTRLIERNATIPTRATQIFTTVVDNQDTVEIHVLQGEREIAAENKSLGRFELVGIPGAPRGVPQIEVTFAIDSSGIVNVSARDLATNKSQSVQINPAGGLSRDEVDRLVKEAARYSDEDAERRQLRRLRNRLEGLVYVNERVYERFRTMLNEGDQRRMRETLSRARTAMFGEDQGELEAAVFDLNSLAAQLSDLMMGVGGSEGAEGSA
jgi:molecular chaperone DnaK